MQVYLQTFVQLNCQKGVMISAFCNFFENFLAYQQILLSEHIIL